MCEHHHQPTSSSSKPTIPLVFGQKPYRARPRPPSPTIAEEHLLLPSPPSQLPIIDTHTHLAVTYDFYKRQYRDGKYKTVYEFAKGLYEGRNVKAIVDVWCDAPISKKWKEYADAALDPADPWNGLEYWFAIGIHPHDSKKYNNKVEADMLEALKHPRCVSLGEIGLDYHYDKSPRDKQREVFIRQLRLAVKLGKPLTLHTREADDDTERILKQEVPKDHKIHLHCFSDSPAFAQRLLEYFPNLYIGITGVISYPSNKNTAAVIRNTIKKARAESSLVIPSSPQTAQHVVDDTRTPLRILLETDAPFMTPSNLYDDMKSLIRGQKLPISHSAMIPWTAKFVADVAADGRNADSVMRESLENTRQMYGI